MSLPDLSQVELTIEDAQRKSCLTLSVETVNAYGPLFADSGGVEFGYLLPMGAGERVQEALHAVLIIALVVRPTAFYLLRESPAGAGADLVVEGAWPERTPYQLAHPGPFAHFKEVRAAALRLADCDLLALDTVHYCEFTPATLTAQAAREAVAICSEIHLPERRDNDLERVYGILLQGERYLPYIWINPDLADSRSALLLEGRPIEFIQAADLGLGEPVPQDAQGRISFFEYPSARSWLGHWLNLAQGETARGG